jgi:hypothetical protein
MRVAFLGEFCDKKNVGKLDADENDDIQTQMHHVWNARQTLP